MTSALRCPCLLNPPEIREISESPPLLASPLRSLLSAILTLFLFPPPPTFFTFRCCASDFTGTPNHRNPFHPFPSSDFPPLSVPPTDSAGNISGIFVPCPPPPLSSFPRSTIHFPTGEENDGELHVSKPPPRRSPPFLALLLPVLSVFRDSRPPPQTVTPSPLQSLRM